MTGDGPGGPPPPSTPQGNRTARFGWAAVVVILIGVTALVVYALTRPPASAQVVHRATTSAGVITSLAKIPPSVFDGVGVSAPTTPLTVPRLLTGQPALTAAGKPEVLYVGAEFCPFCAAERWPLIVALSRFGRFTTLANMVSAPLSAFPSVQTFSFVGVSYSSPYLTFTGVELYSDVAGIDGAYSRIATLSPTQAALVSRYGDPAADGGTVPFVDLADVAVTSTAGFSPAVLLHLSQATIAGALTEASDPATRAIVASANYLTAGICRATGGRPAPVCSSRGVRAAAEAMGLT